MAWSEEKLIPVALGALSMFAYTADIYITISKVGFHVTESVSCAIW